MLIQKLRIILNSNIFLFLLILAAIIRIYYFINIIKNEVPSEDNFYGTIIDITKKDNKYIIILKSNKNLIIYSDNIYNINLGDKVNAVGEVIKNNYNKNFFQFNYNKYLLSKKIYYRINSKKISLIKKNNNLLYALKIKIIKRVNKVERNDYLMSFLLGDNSYLNDKILDSYRINGVSHLFSISGMNISILAGIILHLLNYIKKSKKNYIFVSVILIIYMFITNFYPSIVRATLLYIFLIINKTFNLKLKTFKILLILMFSVLIENPYNIYNLGFQFSYIISLFLIYFNKYIGKFKHYYSKLFIISFISNLASIPITINNYFSINIFSFINNLILVPFVSLIIFPFSIIVLIIPKLDIVFNLLINILEKISIILLNFKIDIVLCHMSGMFIIIYYLIIFYILYKFSKGKYYYILILIIVLFMHTNINKFRNYFYITFLDVGQGDCSFIHLPYNTGNILIDTGGNYNYNLSKNIINYLKSEGIKSIDYLILTHGDFDHMGQAINLVNNFKVWNVIFNNDGFNGLEQQLIHVLKKKKTKYYKKLKVLNIDRIKINFLNTGLYNTENDNSNVIYFKYGNYKFLFMGDAGVNREKDILVKYNLIDIDFLKVGHHGSNTSTSVNFIDNINPKNCLISIDKNNRYGHPKKSVLDTLKNCNIYRTDVNGGIKIKLNKRGYKIKTYST